MSKAIKTKKEITNLLSKNTERLEELGVKRIGLFGSFVRGEQRPHSDVDFLVEFQPRKKTFSNFMGLCFLLEELLGRKVEVVTKESLSPYIGPYILAEVEYVRLVA